MEKIRRNGDAPCVPSTAGEGHGDGEEGYAA
jgi:hypothetical protein